MFWAGQPLLHDSDQPTQIGSPKLGGIKPEAGEEDAVQNPLGVGGDRLIVAILQSIWQCLTAMIQHCHLT